MSIFLGIDSGTQSTKCIALDLERGEIVAEARVSHPMIEGLPSGHLEQHPQSWVLALEKSLRKVLSLIEKSRVKGIGVSGQQHGFVALDEAGEVIRPAKLWCDTSTTAECAILTRQLGGVANVIKKTGVPFLPGYTAPKILWLKRNEPQNFRRLRHVLLPHDYLNFHLTGSFTMEFGDASGTALLDVRRRRWSSAVISAIDGSLGDYLPTPGDSTTGSGSLRPELAKKFGLPPGLPVAAGGGDNMMAAIGTGNVAPGVVTASFGTSGTLFAYSEKPAVDPRGEIAAFCDSTGAWLPLLCTMNVTLVTEYYRTLFGLSHAEMDKVAAAVTPGADGLTLLPFFDGERTPNLPNARAALVGLSYRSGTPGHYVRAAMEGIVQNMRYGLDRLGTLGIKPTEIRLTGGGAKSPVWRQIMADIFGVPVVQMRIDEAAALGAALQAAWMAEEGSHSVGFLRALCARFAERNEDSVCLPNAELTASYLEQRLKHERLKKEVTALSS